MRHEHNNWNKKIELKLKNRYLLLVLSLIIIGLDQLTKHMFRKLLVLYQVKTVVPGFWNWTLGYNRGAAFGFLNEPGPWPKLFFGVIAVVVAVFLINYILNKSYSVITGICLALILGGAVGNLVDRILFGKVTDFIQWYFHDHYWPAFNFADSSICVGVVLLLIEMIFFSRKNCG